MKLGEKQELFMRLLPPLAYNRSLGEHNGKTFGNNR